MSQCLNAFYITKTTQYPLVTKLKVHGIKYIKLKILSAMDHLGNKNVLTYF